MASFTAGTTFADGVANDVTAAKLGVLVTNATPTSGFIQDRTAETVIASNDTVLIGDASDSNNLKRMTVDNLMKAEMTGNINSTSGTIQTLTSSTATITSGTFGGLFNGSLNTTTGTIGTFNSTTATIPTLTSTTLITSGTGTASAPAIVPTGDTNNGLFFPSADNIAVSTNGTERVRVDSSGNVGIGTTSPTDAKLSVHANNLTIPAISARYSAAGYKMGFGVYNVLGYPYLGLNCNQVSSSNNQTYDLSAHATKLDMSIDGSTPGFVFSTAASGTAGSAITWSERLRIDSSGNVGIGTSSPRGRLEVPSTLLSGETGAQCIFPLTVTIGYGGNDYGSIGYNLDYRSATNNTTGVKYLASATISQLDFNAGGFIFRNAPSGTGGNTATLTERLRIDSSGNVGIGNTSPSSYNSSADNLVIGNAGDNGITIVSGTDGKGYLFFADGVSGTNAYAGQVDFDHSVNALKFGVLATERLRIDSSGNVGIGTTGAVNKLEIVGSFGRGAPVTKTGDFTLADTENWLIVNKGSSCTVTLPAASSWTGREFTIKVITAHTVVSASSNVVPRNSATAGTAILAATAGSWATLVSNGTNWVIMCGS